MLLFFFFYLPGAEEHSGQSKLEVIVIQSQSFKQSLQGINHAYVKIIKKKKMLHEFRLVQHALLRHLAEESWIEACQLVRHVLFVHVVELMEGSSGGEAPLHQVQH